MGVKASGGIETAEQAYILLEAGATRIGTSRAVEIVSGDKKR
jgi:deoxyribose-phosphate aldolase